MSVEPESSKKGMPDHDEMRDMVLHQLACIAFVNFTNLVEIRDGKVYAKDLSEISENDRQAIKSIRRTPYGDEVVIYDKVRALILIGKHLGMWSGNGIKIQAEFSGRTESELTDLINALPEMEQEPEPIAEAPIAPERIAGAA